MNSEKEKEIKKALECCVNYAKLQVKSEQFERNMKNVLEIEKKQAVKEFAEKFKEKSRKGAFNDPVTYKFIERDYTITESELKELLEVYENGKSL